MSPRMSSPPGAVPQLTPTHRRQHIDTSLHRWLYNMLLLNALLNALLHFTLYISLLVLSTLFLSFLGRQVKVASGILTALNSVLDELVWTSTSVLQHCLIWFSCYLFMLSFHVIIHRYDVLIVGALSLPLRCRHVVYHFMIVLSDSFYVWRHLKTLRSESEHVVPTTFLERAMKWVPSCVPLRTMTTCCRNICKSGLWHLLWTFSIGVDLCWFLCWFLMSFQLIPLCSVGTPQGSFLTFRGGILDCKMHHLQHLRSVFKVLFIQGAHGRNCHRFLAALFSMILVVQKGSEGICINQCIFISLDAFRCTSQHVSQRFPCFELTGKEQLDQCSTLEILTKRVSH